MAKTLDIDKMLADADKGKGPSDMGKQHGFIKQYVGSTMPAPKSNAPAGEGFHKLPKDIGKAVQDETMKAFRRPIKNAGPAVRVASYLPYRKPAIEGGAGPHAV